MFMLMFKHSIQPSQNGAFYPSLCCHNGSHILISEHATLQMLHSPYMLVTLCHPISISVVSGENEGVWTPPLLESIKWEILPSKRVIQPNHPTASKHWKHTTKIVISR